MNVLSSLVLVAVLAQARPAPLPPSTAQQEKKTPPTAQGTKPTASTLTAKSAASVDLALQVALDRAGFSPGAIDGQAGSSTKKALEAHRKLNGGDPPVVEPTTQYQITAEDAAGPFEPHDPKRASGPGKAAGAFVQDRRRISRRAVPLDAGVPEEVESQREVRGRRTDRRPERGADAAPDQGGRPKPRRSAKARHRDRSRRRAPKRQARNRRRARNVGRQPGAPLRQSTSS